MKRVFSILFALVLVVSLIVIAAPGASAVYSYVNAEYGGPLAIKLNGDSSAGQTFNVGDTIAITGNINAVAQMCGWQNEAYTEYALAVSGPSGPDSVTDWDYDYSGTDCAESWTIITPTIVYTPTVLGTHTVYMFSDAQVAYAGWDADRDFAEDSLTFEVVEVALELGVETEKAKVCWHHDDLHVEGNLSLPEGVWMDTLSPVGSAVITLAGVEVTDPDQNVVFEITGKKDDKWEYKDKENLLGPIKEFKIDWKGAKFDYKGDDKFHIHTHFIGASETTLCIHTGDVSGAFTVSIDGTTIDETTIEYDAGRSITTELAYEPQKDDNTHVHFTLPFQLISDMTIEVSGAVGAIDVAAYYKEGVAKFKLVSAFDPESFGGTATVPDELEYEISLSDPPVMGGGLIEAWTKDDKHWEYK